MAVVHVRVLSKRAMTAQNRVFIEGLAQTEDNDVEQRTPIKLVHLSILFDAISCKDGEDDLRTTEVRGSVKRLQCFFSAIQRGDVLHVDGTTAKHCLKTGGEGVGSALACSATQMNLLIDEQQVVEKSEQSGRVKEKQLRTAAEPLQQGYNAEGKSDKHNQHDIIQAGSKSKTKSQRPMRPALDLEVHSVGVEVLEKWNDGMFRDGKGSASAMFHPPNVQAALQQLDGEEGAGSSVCETGAILQCLGDCTSRLLEFLNNFDEMHQRGERASVAAQLNQDRLIHVPVSNWFWCQVLGPLHNVLMHAAAKQIPRVMRQRLVEHMFPCYLRSVVRRVYFLNRLEDADSDSCYGGAAPMPKAAVSLRTAQRYLLAQQEQNERQRHSTKGLDAGAASPGATGNGLVAFPRSFERSLCEDYSRRSGGTALVDVCVYADGLFWFGWNQPWFNLSERENGTAPCTAAWKLQESIWRRLVPTSVDSLLYHSGTARSGEAPMSHKSWNDAPPDLQDVMREVGLSLDMSAGAGLLESPALRSGSEVGNAGRRCNNCEHELQEHQDQDSGVVVQKDMEQEEHLVALDVGAAPGGWSHVLGKVFVNSPHKKLVVLAVDPAALDPSVLAQSGEKILHIKDKAENLFDRAKLLMSGTYCSSGLMSSSRSLCSTMSTADDVATQMSGSPPAGDVNDFSGSPSQVARGEELTALFERGTSLGEPENVTHRCRKDDNDDETSSFDAEDELEQKGDFEAHIGSKRSSSSSVAARVQQVSSHDCEGANLLRRKSCVLYVCDANCEPEKALDLLEQARPFFHPAYGCCFVLTIKIRCSQSRFALRKKALLERMQRLTKNNDLAQMEGMMTKSCERTGSYRGKPQTQGWYAEHHLFANTKHETTIVGKIFPL
ncbi:unnamed protein product [Amoebophrya sp. A120]|nr:unnamed protein product [Amoebophrya sp. A120]|eukprot:GSA120T00015246001.1